MTRVKKGVHALKRRRKILKQTKGFRHGRKSKERMAKDALLHAGKHAFHDRRKKKRNMRALWQVKINAAARTGGLSYSKLISKLKKSEVALDRKILAQLAEYHPQIFSKIAAM
ncbi:MAG: 50S ribosomal protein L20 [Candidatus Pacebacteria bacterium]|nr:50S ribosomal protein L20 [Candidatus Paceibacterota bacterium]NUQ57238.1 50S ribosomal protein L20 [Candidatus Paceibacter sp.]